MLDVRKMVKVSMDTAFDISSDLQRESLYALYYIHVLVKRLGSLSEKIYQIGSQTLPKFQRSNYLLQLAP